MVVTSWDKTGRAHIMQLAVLITSGKAPGVGSTSTGTPNITSNTGAPTLQQAKHWLWFVWPPLIITVLMVGCFWLGERKEYALMLESITKKRRPTRRGR
jgi:hypothetical protein